MTGGSAEGTPNLSRAIASPGAGEVYREIKCCFSVTIRRDAWGVPVAIMGQWIVSSARSPPLSKRKGADEVACIANW